MCINSVYLKDAQPTPYKMENGPNELHTQSSSEPSSHTSSTSDFKDASIKKLGAPNKSLILIIIILFVVIMVVLSILGSRSGGNGKSGAEPTPIIFDELTTPTIQPEIDKKSIRFSVLNGTGIAKEATYLENILKGMGYETIKTGNAESTTYTSAQVKFSESIPDSISKEILEKLKEVYTQVETKNQIPSQDIDVEIITGLRQGVTKPTTILTSTPKPENNTQTITPTVSNTPSVTITNTPQQTPTETPSPTP